MNRLIVMLGVVLLTGCAGPTKSGKVARVNAHNRMDIVNANLAAQHAMQQFEVGQLKAAIETVISGESYYSPIVTEQLLQHEVISSES